MLPANFNQLYYFWVVARTGTISGAAERLLLNQSTVSLQMKQLEASLGHPLLLRGRHGIALTEAGETAYEHCQRIFEHADELLAALRGENRPATPLLRLGVSQSVPRDKVVVVNRFLAANEPGIRVKIVSRSSEELESRLARRLLDLVISDLDLSVRLGPEFRGRLVWNAPLHFVASPRLKKRAGRFPQALARLPLLVRNPENPIQKQVDVLLHRLGLLPNVHAEFESPDLMRIMAAAGEGAAVLDLASAQAELRAGSLAPLHARPLDVRETIWLIAPKEQAARPSIRKLTGLTMSRFRPA